MEVVSLARNRVISSDTLLNGYSVSSGFPHSGLRVEQLIAIVGILARFWSVEDVIQFLILSLTPFLTTHLGSDREGLLSLGVDPINNYR